jgi:peptidyl-prolyl cis-trans isomerase D
MFDLFRRKDTNLRVLLMVLLGLVALSMVVTLIPGFGTSGINVGPGEETVAKVCGDPVTAKEVRLKVQQMLNKQSLPPESAAIFIPQFVDQYVAVKGVACFAHEAGMLASDKDVALKIQKDVPALWQDGKFVGAEMYARMLQQSGLTVAQFEDSMKKDIETQRLRMLVLMSAVATPKEVEKFFKESEEKIKIDFVAIDPAEQGKFIKVSDEELKAEYEKNKSSYKTKESREVALYRVDQSRAESGLQISENELKQLYQENLENYRSPERVRTRHILFKTSEKPESEDKKMKDLADQVYKQLKAGAKFEDLAKKYSEDPGSKERGGDIGFVVRGQTTKNYDEYAFTGPMNQPSTPIKTEFGYHIIENLEKAPAGVRSFEEVKGSLEAELRASKAADLLARTVDSIRKELEKSGGKSSETAARLGITPIRFEYETENTQVPGIGPKPEFFAAIRTAKVGEVSMPLTVTDKSQAVLVTEKVKPSVPATFEQVRSEIYSRIFVEKNNKQVAQKKDQGVALLKANHGDLAALAKELGTTVKSSQEFNRQGFADGLGPASALAEAFNKKVGETVGPISLDGKWFFVKVTGRVEADLNQLPARRAEIVNLVKNRKAAERADIFEETLVKKMIKDGKIVVYEDAKKRIAQSYGG